MVQKIICETCADEAKKLFPNYKKTETKYQGEHVKLVFGKAKDFFVCDDCGIQLAEKENVCTLSIWADSGMVKYYPWESEYIEIDPLKNS